MYMCLNYVSRMTKLGNILISLGLYLGSCIACATLSMPVTMHTVQRYGAILEAHAYYCTCQMCISVVRPQAMISYYAYLASGMQTLKSVQISIEMIAKQECRLVYHMIGI